MTKGEEKGKSESNPRLKQRERKDTLRKKMDKHQMSLGEGRIEVELTIDQSNLFKVAVI